MNIPTPLTIAHTTTLIMLALYPASSIAAPSDGQTCRLVGVNDSGAVTGQCRTSSGDFVASYWASGATAALRLNTVVPTGTCDTLGIANDGQIAGNCEFGKLTRNVPTIWRTPSLPSAAPTFLNGRIGDDRAVAVSINPAGAIIGISTSPGGKDFPVIWKSGETAATPLPIPGTLPPLLTSVIECRAMAIEPTAIPQAAGVCDLRQGGHVAVKWVPNSFGGYSVVMLPRLPDGDSCIATAINAAGYVAGTCEDGAGDMSAVRWAPSLASPTFLRRVPREAADTQQVFAADINSAGIVTGNYIADDGRVRSFVWAPVDVPANEDGLDLGLLGGTEAYARQIADNGRILGTTDTAQGAQVGFLWTPSSGIQYVVNLGGPSNSPALISPNGTWIVGAGMIQTGYWQAYRSGPTLELLSGPNEPLAVGGYPQLSLSNPAPVCQNTSADCVVWEKNGFCTTTFYSREQKAKSCAATCNLCRH